MRKLLACSAVGVVVFGGVLAACGGGGGGGGSQQAFCDALKKDQAAFSDLDNQSDLDNSQSLSLIGKAFDELEAKAPSEIKSDMQTVNKALKALSSAAEQFSDAQSNGDFSKLSDLEQSFSDQNSGFEKASENVDKYAKDKCGIDLNSDSSSSSSRSSSRSSSSSSDRLSDLSDLSDFSDFSDLSNLSDLSNRFSDFSDLSDLSSLSNLSDLSSLGSDLSSIFSR